MLGLLPAIAATVCALFFTLATAESTTRKAVCSALLLLGLAVHFLLPAFVALSAGASLGAWGVANLLYLAVATWVITYYRIYS